MQEQYLFRGKRLDNGEWVVGFLAQMLSEISSIRVKDGETIISVRVITSTVGQCTGLHAAKSYRGESEADRMLYEGDIYHQGDKNIKYVVVWHDSGLIGKQLGSSSYAGLGYWLDKIEIVGTIHDGSPCD